MAGRPMFQKILVGYDGSQGASGAPLGAVDRSRVRLRGVRHPVEGKLPRYAATLGGVEEVEQERYQYFDRIQDEAKRMADEHGVSLGTIVAPRKRAETIVKYAEDGG